MFIHTVHKNPELEAFRHEVREFCNAHLAPNTRRKLELGQHLERDEHDAWLRAVGAKGWLTGKWPVEHGGLGWGPEQAAILSKELGAAGAPWLIPFGTTMVGPAIYTFGTEAQKQQYLPAIAANETWWCQGYSEPGAGSDLASLRTRAVLDGDTYVVNGQKIWTTLAHWANMMFYLVRTDPDVKKQDGISFLLIDMNTPGITVKPIVSIDMSHHLNEVFFDDVRVPRENLIGEPNKDWTYAKFLLANERVGVAEVDKFKRYISQYQQLLAQTSDAGKPLLENQEFRAQLADLNTRLASLQALVNDQLAAPQVWTSHQ